MKLSEFCGPVVYGNGVYSCPFEEILKTDQLSKYRALLTKSEHWDMKIIGNFSLKSDRDSLSAASKELLKSPAFLGGLKKTLDSFAARESGNNMFAHLVDRCNNDHQIAMLSGAKA